MSTNQACTAVAHNFANVKGQEVFYRTAGILGNPVFVLLHGFPSSSHMYRDLIPMLAERFYVIAPDYIGFGHSAAPDTLNYEYTFANQTETVAALLQALNVEKYFLYMQDYGGPIGFRLATGHPERVLGLVVQNANAYMEGVSQAAADVFMPLWQKGDESGALKMLLAETTKFQYTAGARNPSGLNPDAWFHDQAHLDREGSTARHMTMFKDYQTNVALYGEWQQYFRTRQPKTLIVWGKGDPFFGVAGAEAFKRDLPNAHVHLLDTGHFALEEDAAAIADLINDFF